MSAATLCVFLHCGALTPSPLFSPCSWRDFINNYTAQGGDAFNLIEPVDGFHPSQTGNMLLAEILWEDLSANKPGWLPAINPFNAQIEAIFGDQGGY